MKWLPMNQAQPDPGNAELAMHVLNRPVAVRARPRRRESIHAPANRPTNYARSLFHVASAGVALSCIELLRAPVALLAIAVGWAAFAWTCEVARRVSPWVNARLMRLFGPVAHAHETHRVNSATWYATALVLLALTGSTVLCATGVVVLGVGDPIAALVGRRWGRTKLVHGRSLEGTLAFVVSAGTVMFVLLTLLHGPLSLQARLLLATGAAVAGALAELFSVHVDDNLSVPVSAAAGAWLVATLANVAL